MNKFEVVSKYEGKDINLPTRKTKYSAGYDFEVAEDITIPSSRDLIDTMERGLIPSAGDMFGALFGDAEVKTTFTLDEIAAITKKYKLKPTLVPTGIKCQLDPDKFLQLSVRSSCPLKYWLILANGVGIIDSDYYNNPDNEGEIFFQIINLSPVAIQLKKGDVIGQGVILPYYTVDKDKTVALRVGGFGSTDWVDGNLVYSPEAMQS